MLNNGNLLILLLIQEVNDLKEEQLLFPRKNNNKV